MRVRKRDGVSPVYVSPNDTVKVVVTETVDGKIVNQVETYTTIGRPLTIDTLLIVDYEQRELDELGLSDAIGGVFGTAATE